MLELFYFLLSLALGIARLHGVKSLLFQGIAHIVVGGFFGAGFVHPERERRWFYLSLAIALTLLETVAFTYGLLHGE